MLSQEPSLTAGPKPEPLFDRDTADGGGARPLRGRARMELVVRPFWFREAAGPRSLGDFG